MVSKKILCVDDESEILEVLESFLESLDYNVFTASDGVKAFELIKKQKDINLVITDVRMPNGDGVELLKNIKAEMPSIPVIVISGFTDYSLDEIYRYGADSILYKPFCFDELEKNLKKLF
jgi:CheY-like chemotaxis protein